MGYSTPIALPPPPRDLWWPQEPSHRAHNCRAPTANHSSLPCTLRPLRVLPVNLAFPSTSERVLGGQSSDCQSWARSAWAQGIQRLVKGRQAGLMGKGSGRGRAAQSPSPHLPSRVPASALPRTCAGLPPSPGAALGDQRTRRSRAQGEGAGNFPPRLPGPAPLPLSCQVGGTAWGIPPRQGSGEPGLGS